MATRKTKADTSERIHIEYPAIDACLHVVAGGRRGPFTLIVDRLSEAEVRLAIDAVLAATGRKALP